MGGGTGNGGGYGRPTNQSSTHPQSTHYNQTDQTNRMPAQLLVRFILGLYLWGAFVAFRRAASAKFGADTGGWMCTPLWVISMYQLG